MRRTERQQQWLYQAAGTLAALTPERTLVLRPTTTTMRKASRPSRKRRGKNLFCDLHGHDVPEVCLTLEGEAALDTPERRLVLRPPMLAVVLPGVAHAEGYARRAQRYTLLWLVGAGAGQLTLHVVQYDGRGHWRPQPLATVRTRLGGWLVGRLSSRRDAGAGTLRQLRAEMLGLIGELLRQGAPAAQPEMRPRPRPERRAELATTMRHWLDRHYAQPVRLADLAAMVGLSPNHANVLFKQRVGCTVHQYLLQRRMARALELCRSTPLLVKQVAAQVGYCDPLYFSRCFRRAFGIAPSAWGG